MSVSFHGISWTVDLSNGTASRLLRAIGYPVSEETAGAMPLEQAREGIDRARELLSARIARHRLEATLGQITPAGIDEALRDGEDLATLWLLSDVVDALRAKGRADLRWS